MDGETIRKWGPRVLLAAAVLCVAISLIIGRGRYGPNGQWSLSQANGLCATATGQAAQLTSTAAAANCAAINSAEQARGWLLISGVVGGLAALGWNAYEVRAPSRSPTAG